jgi:hypothetical protein
MFARGPFLTGGSESLLSHRRRASQGAEPARGAMRGTRCCSTTGTIEAAHTHPMQRGPRVSSPGDWGDPHGPKYTSGRLPSGAKGAHEGSSGSEQVLMSLLGAWIIRGPRGGFQRRCRRFQRECRRAAAQSVPELADTFLRREYAQLLSRHNPELHLYRGSTRGHPHSLVKLGGACGYPAAAHFQRRDTVDTSP